MRSLRLTLTLTLLGATMLNANAMAAPTCSATASTPVALVELYTSEGCSSCPPADAWLSRLAHSAAVPAHVVPLALHVPYWDYIGWHDRFASPVFERRQRAAVAAGRSPTVYTPQVMLNGHDFQAWTRGGLDDALRELARHPARATLSITSHLLAGTQAVTLSGSAPAGSEIVLVRYENGLSSEVKSGENTGLRLYHDQVVRDWWTLGRVDASRQIAFTRSLPVRTDMQMALSGLAAFVERDGEVLQAVMLPHCTGS